MERSRRRQVVCALHERISVVDTAAEEDALLDRLAAPEAPTIISFVNAHAVNLAWKDPAIGDTFLRSDLLVRDGIGVEIGLRLLGRQAGRNLNGTDLIPRLADRFDGRRVALLGTQDPWLAKARTVLEAQGLEIVACEHGFAEPEHYVDVVRTTDPDFVVLAMGMPKQESVALALRSAATRPITIVNGGAILDFLGGKVARAPSWMRRARIEWVYRLVNEPRRLASRYLVGNPMYVTRLVSTRLGLGRISGSTNV